MLGSRVLRQGLRAPALRAPLAKTNSFPNFVRHNSEKVKGTVVGIGTYPLQRIKETDMSRSRNDEFMCCNYGGQDPSCFGEQ
jgi:hypothetical protein